MAKNILVVRNDRFGEFLLIVPALRALKERFPQSRITIVVNPKVVELADAIEYVDDTIIWEEKKHPFKEVVEFSGLIRGREFDLVVIFNPSKEFNLISFLARIPVRVGYSRKWGFLLTHKMKDEKDKARAHEVYYNLELVALIGATTKDRSLALKVADTDLLGGVKGSNIVVIHPWTSDPVKQWPLSRFEELIRKLVGLDIVVIGGKEELLKNRDFFSRLQEVCINLTGKTNLIELAEVLKKAKLLVSGDSGPVHLAAAVGTPVIALFRNDLPGKTAKRWGPWGEGHVVIEKDKLEDITVDEVFKKVREKLEGDII